MKYILHLKIKIWAQVQVMYIVVGTDRAIYSTVKRHTAILLKGIELFYYAQSDLCKFMFRSYFNHKF